MDYFCTRAERFLVGELRQAPTPEQLQSGFVQQSLGLLGSRVTWRPDSEKELREALEQLETQPQSRSFYRPELVGGSSSSFFLANTGSTALLHRKEVVERLQPARLALLTWERLRKYGLVAGFSRLLQTTAEGLLGIELSLEECNEILQLVHTFKDYSALSIPSCLLWLTPGFRTARRRYQKWVETVLQREIRKIQMRLHDKSPVMSEEPDGLLAQKVLQKMRQNPNCETLHRDPDLKSLFLLILVAVDNVVDTRDNFSALGRELLAKLGEEVLRTGVVQNGVLDPSKIIKESMPILDDCYRLCLEKAFPSSRVIMTRRVTHRMRCGAHDIPPFTHLLITNPVSGVPFSTGRRICPGRFIAESVLKTQLILASIPTLYATRGPTTVLQLMTPPAPGRREIPLVQKSCDLADRMERAIAEDHGSAAAAV